MKIAVIGAGNMGHGLANRMSRAGHDVMVANSRGPDTLRDLAAETGATPATVGDAVRDAEVVFLAMPYKAVGEIAAAGGSWDGKVVVDLTNYYEGRDGAQLDPGEESSSVIVARQLPGARVVKAFNTMLAQALETESGVVVFYATDDDGAGEIVAQLIRDAGFVPLKTGGLREGGRRQEPGTDIYASDMREDDARAILRR